MSGPDYIADKMSGLLAGTYGADGEGEAPAPPENVSKLGVDNTLAPTNEVISEAFKTQKAVASEEVQATDPPKQSPDNGDQDPLSAIKEELRESNSLNKQIFYNLRKNNEKRALELATPDRPPLIDQPDAETDPESFATWTTEVARRNKEDQEIQVKLQGDKEAEIKATVELSETNFRTTRPDYDNAIKAGYKLRVDWYVGGGYTPAQAYQQVNQELSGLIVDFHDRGVDPAASLYKIATDNLTAAKIDWNALVNPAPTPVPAVPTPVPAVPTPAVPRPLPSLAALGGGPGSNQPPVQGMSTITAEQFVAKIPHDARIAIGINNPGFMAQLRQHNVAVIPESLEGILRS